MKVFRHLQSDEAGSDNKGPPHVFAFDVLLDPVCVRDVAHREDKRIGVCGSDIHVYHGAHPYTGYSVVQGHEVSGVVAEVGESFQDFESADRVTFIPQITCGRRYPCRHGSYRICDSLRMMGFQADGAGQEYLAVAADKVLKIPAETSLDEGAMIEPSAAALHALGRESNRANLKPVESG